ncbi:MAG: transcriptional regulator [Citrobacter freundii]|nr:MAG: transcriptional regulator [Citrobacter freundii]
MKAKKGKKIPIEPGTQLSRLGERIKDLRKNRMGYTSAEIFAYEHGFGRTQYARYENGEDLRFSTLVKIVSVFDMSLEEFFADGF